MSLFLFLFDGYLMHLPYRHAEIVIGAPAARTVRASYGHDGQDASGSKPAAFLEAFGDQGSMEPLEPCAPVLLSIRAAATRVYKLVIRSFVVAFQGVGKGREVRDNISALSEWPITERFFYLDADWQV